MRSRPGRRGGIPMRGLVRLGACLVLACFAGCRSSEQHEAVLRGMVETWDELADVLEQVRDKETAREAAGKVDKIYNRFEDLIRKSKSRPRVSKREDKRLAEKFQPDTDRVSKRFGNAVFSALMKSNREKTLVESLRRLPTALGKEPWPLDR